MSKATARPWSHAEGYKSDGHSDDELKGYRTRDIHGARIEKFGKTLCGYALAKVRFDQVGEEMADANAELIVRAVNSFAAMREVCQTLIDKYEAAAEKHAVREGVLAMADGLPYSETAVLPESPLVQAARKALALANNTEH